MAQKQGSRVQTMPEYGGTLPVVIASHGKPLPQKVLDSSIPRQFLDMLDSF